MDGMDENRVVVVVVVAEERGGHHHAHTHVPIVATFGRNCEELRARARKKMQLRRSARK
jgi:hypothetical protein